MTLQNFTLGTFAQGAAGGGGAFESIATATPSSGATSITFNSIPGTYQHLQIRAIYRDTATTAGQEAPLYLRINNDTSSNYAWHYLRGNGTSAVASGQATISWIRLDAAGVCDYTSSGIFGANIIDILDYASSSKNKTIRHFGGSDANTSGTQFRVSLSSGFINSTTAITRLDILAGNTAFASGSTFALYGIKGA